MITLLPPNATKLERALEAGIAALADVPAPIGETWDPATCDPALLPWIAFGLSVDLWDPAWSEAQKRQAVAESIILHRQKGTRASLRMILDRIDPMIAIVEWFEDRDVLEPYSFRLELPLAADSEVLYDETLVAALLRDIATVKPVRAHMLAVHKLAANARAWLVSGAQAMGFVRLDAQADSLAASDPVWGHYLQTEDGEPILAEDNSFLEHR